MLGSFKMILAYELMRIFFFFFELKCKNMKSLTAQDNSDECAEICVSCLHSGVAPTHIDGW
jgi:hypothetical protein